MTAPLRVAVIGGGVSGLSAVLALRAAGMVATAYERSDELGTAQAGNGLVVWHNATRALRAIGLDEHMHKIGAPLDRYLWRNARGGQLAEWSISDGATRTGALAYTVSRPALHKMLSEEAGASLVLGARCVGWEEFHDRVVVRFDDGTEDVVDLLVGADGLRSTVRRALYRHEPPPTFAGVTAWQGVVPVHDLTVPEGTFVNTFGPGLWFVYYRLPGGLVYWDGVVSEKVSRGLLNSSALGATGLTSLFAGWPAPIPDLIAATDPSLVQPVDIFDRDPVQRWSTDRVTLVGDAAHPMTFNLGQGANQAIEGAVVLADSLASAASVPEGLHAYEQRRVARAASLVRRSRANGVFSKLSNPAVCAGRDAFMRVAFGRLIYRKTYQLTMDMSPWTTWSNR